MISGAEVSRIGRALASVAGWTSEIIVVLNEEVTDGTDRVAAEHGAKVFREPWKGHVAQKNSAAQKATQTWILGLDADEAVSPKLRAQLEQVLANPEAARGCAAYQFARCTFYGGRWIRHGDWYPDRKARLWQRGLAKWGGTDPHDRLEVNGRIGTLPGDLLHYSMESPEHQVQKMLRYANDFAQACRVQGRRVGYCDLLLRPLWRFCRSFLLRLGFLDGWQGLSIAWMTAFYTFLRYLKAIEDQASRSMRILHVNNEKTWRGGERQTWLTALEQRRQGADCRLACRPGSPLEKMAREEGLPTVALGPAVPAALLGLRRSAAACDLVHCHTGRAHSLAALATLGRRQPLVVSRRVDFVPANSWFNRWKYRRADRVVCVSQCILRILEEWGLPPEKLSVVYEAVPGDSYLPRETCLNELRAHTDVKAGQRIVGNIAALVGHKDHATLLRAADIVVRARPEVALVIIGEGKLKGRLLQLRRELGLERNVHFTGFIPQAQRLLPAFDVFAMSSCKEGLGTIVLDAALAGVPVAATAGGGLPEVVRDGQTGLLAPVGDAPALAQALLRLLDDAALADRLTRAARLRVEQEFCVPHMARQYLEVYLRILSTTGSKQPIVSL